MGILSMDSRFMKFMDQAVDLLLLNLLWLVFSLPLVTLGAATAAASAWILKGLDGHDEPLVRAFWREFRRNLRRGTGLWGLQALVLAALAADVRLLTVVADPPLVLVIVGVVTALFAFCAFVYVYPLTARYENTAPRTIQNSMKLCFRFPGQTLLLVLLLVLELALFSWNTTMFFFGLVVGPMVLLTTVAGIARGLFRSLEASAVPSE